MVKVECTDSGDSSDVEILGQTVPLVGSSGSKPCSGLKLVKEETLPSSSSGHLKSYFIGMGFSPTLVDKVIEENGEDHTDLLLEALLKHSALQKSSPDASNSLDEFSSFDGEEGSPLEFTTDDSEENQELNVSSNVDLDKKSYLLTMDFSEEEVDLAISHLGENAPLTELVDFIVTAQSESFPGQKEMNASCSGDVGKNEENTTEALFGMMDKTLYLLQMGFTEDEVSSAIDNFGPEVSMLELADSIFASRIAHRVDKEEDVVNDAISIKKESDYLGSATEDCSKCCFSVTDTWEDIASSSHANFYEYEEKVRIKKAKHGVVDDNTASTSIDEQARLDKMESTCQTRPNSYNRQRDSAEADWIKEEMPEEVTRNQYGNVVQPRPPYFFYGNVVDVSQDTWRKLSQFLYLTEPEFANTQFFSAFIRKEGYIHNLPTRARFHILPKPPMTIEDALPHTRRWWPSWDTRKQLSCINSDTTGVEQMCEQLEKMLRDSEGMLSKEQQTNILHQCKTLNLIWVGEHKLSPIRPDQVERILGYPMHHTRIWGLEPDERLKALKYGFQTDTLGYHLSVLKGMFPDGLRVLSVYSGIGGAEVALHRLGIHLKCVVSVEASDINRKIMRRWWHSTGQSGELRQLGGIEKLTIQRLEDFVSQFGGFDIIIGGNPGTCARGSSNVNSLMGMDLNLFFEYVRVFQRVRSIMGRNG
ncbi:DNA (Cytosine-5)-methyltransferase DRM2 [Cocos nucifera]|uniref:DNA (Cytosine-5)-methyltransferase DRM2 n=1 Tax=Cocos nucifera TaxID=13894 RepID=A0A8K0N082_COCNU|nr:DNA (Cytosine-5)-methyltransferase DRM2 [Cocos nucifera]